MLSEHRSLGEGVSGATKWLFNGYDTHMPRISDNAIVLRRLDYSETSQVVVFFTQDHGKARAIAKGVKRSTKTKVGVGMDLLDVGHVGLTTRQDRGDALAIVTEWKQTRAWSGLRDSLKRLYAAQYLAEIIGQLTEDWDPHSTLFASVVDGLGCIADADDPLPTVVSCQYDLLHAIGSQPHFDACVVCHRTDSLTHFSSLEGGTVCRHCEAVHVEKREIASDTIHALHARDFSKASVGAFDVLNYHISHLMGKEPVLADKLVPAHVRRLIQ